MAALGNAMQAKPPQFLNSGDSDASPDGTPSQFLLIRGLEPSVTEELLAKGVAKMYKPSGGLSPPTAAASKKGGAKVASTTGDANLGAKEGSIRRVLLVRDRRNDESWRYGFAEFATVDVCAFQVLQGVCSSQSFTGCPGCTDQVQLVREVHHLVEACHCELHPRRCICARLRYYSRHRKVYL